jgi:transposase
MARAGEFAMRHGPWGLPAVCAARSCPTPRLQSSRNRSWVGACPGDDEGAGVNYNHRSPKGNRHMRRVLNQAANAAARVKGSIFEIAYRRSVPRLGHNQTIGAIAHRQCRLIWLSLHQGVRYEERGPAVTKKSRQARTARIIRQLRTLGYRVELENSQSSNPIAR